MSTITRPTIWVCDFCGLQAEAKNGRPQNFCGVKLEADSPGFEYWAKLDVCNECLPKSYFRDPPYREKPPKKFMDYILSFLKLQKGQEIEQHRGGPRD